MGLYEKLLKQKENGQKTSFDDITKEELIKLWWGESVGDNRIAELFDISGNKVKNKRYTWNIKRHDMLFADLRSRMNEVQNIQHIPLGKNTNRVEEIKQQILKCSQEEQFAIIQYLAEINPEIRNILDESRAYRIMLKATSKF